MIGMIWVIWVIWVIRMLCINICMRMEGSESFLGLEYPYLNNYLDRQYVSRCVDM